MQIVTDIEFNTVRSNIESIKAGDILVRCGTEREVLEVSEIHTAVYGDRVGKIFRLVTFRTSPTSQTSTTIREH